MADLVCTLLVCLLSYRLPTSSTVSFTWTVMHFGVRKSREGWWGEGGSWANKLRQRGEKSLKFFLSVPRNLSKPINLGRLAPFSPSGCWVSVTDEKEWAGTAGIRNRELSASQRCRWAGTNVTESPVQVGTVCSPPSLDIKRIDIDPHKMEPDKSAAAQSV